MHQLTQLDQGPRLLTVHMPEVQSVSVMVFFAVGSRYEQLENAGVSHFLEHMFFKGTEKRPLPQSISEEIDAIGGEMNAGTSKEYTLYYIKARGQHFDLCLEVLTDMLLNSKFDPEEVRKESGVILEELRMYEDSPTSVVGEAFEETMFQGTPLSRKVIGREETILGMNEQQLREYRDQHYSLSNMVVGIGGNFDPSEIEYKVQQAFKGFSAGSKSKAVGYDNDQSGPRYRVLQRATEQAHVVLGVKALHRHDPRRYVARVLNTILGASMSSRLFISLREKSGLCYYINSGMHSYDDTGSFTVSAGVDLTRLEQALSKIMVELELLKSELVSPKEFIRAKEFMKGRMALALEDPSSVVEWVAMQELLTGNIRTLEDIYQEIDAVTPEAIQALAQEFFINNQLTVAIIGPEDMISEERLGEIVRFEEQ